MTKVDIDLFLHRETYLCRAITAPNESMCDETQNGIGPSPLGFGPESLGRQYWEAFHDTT